MPTSASAINAYKRTANAEAPQGAAVAASNDGASPGSLPASADATGAGPSSSELSGPVALTQSTDAGPPRPATGTVPSAAPDAGAPLGGFGDDESDDDESDDD